MKGAWAQGARHRVRGRFIGLLEFIELLGLLGFIEFRDPFLRQAQDRPISFRMTKSQYQQPVNRNAPLETVIPYLTPTASCLKPILFLPTGR
jgi:hypothetical protein